jgi:hypothetical protein
MANYIRLDEEFNISQDSSVGSSHTFLSILSIGGQLLSLFFDITRLQYYSSTHTRLQNTTLFEHPGQQLLRLPSPYSTYPSYATPH